MKRHFDNNCENCKLTMLLTFKIRLNFHGYLLESCQHSTNMPYLQDKNIAVAADAVNLQLKYFVLCIRKWKLIRGQRTSDWWPGTEIQLLHTPQVDNWTLTNENRKNAKIKGTFISRWLLNNISFNMIDLC